MGKCRETDATRGHNHKTIAVSDLPCNRSDCRSSDHRPHLCGRNHSPHPCRCRCRRSRPAGRPPRGRKRTGHRRALSQSLADHSAGHGDAGGAQDRAGSHARRRSSGAGPARCLGVRWQPGADPPRKPPLWPIRSKLAAKAEARTQRSTAPRVAHMLHGPAGIERKAAKTAVNPRNRVQHGKFGLDRAKFEKRSNFSRVLMVAEEEHL